MKLQSRSTIEGPSRAPHRAMYKAMGLSDEDLERPLVGVSTTSNESTPCNVHLGRLAQYAKDGVKEVKCTPREFTTISVSDVISMGHEGMKCSLISREIIADSIELMVRAHKYDALVGIVGCDKSLPVTLIGMARLNLPAIFVYGGIYLFLDLVYGGIHLFSIELWMVAILDNDVRQPKVSFTIDQLTNHVGLEVYLKFIIFEHESLVKCCSIEPESESLVLYRTEIVA